MTMTCTVAVDTVSLLRTLRLQPDTDMLFAEQTTLCGAPVSTAGTTTGIEKTPVGNVIAIVDKLFCVRPVMENLAAHAPQGR